MRRLIRIGDGDVRSDRSRVRVHWQMEVSRNFSLGPDASLWSRFVGVLITRLRTELFMLVFGCYCPTNVLMEPYPEH